MKHKEPFFILANPRSGSSLFRIICDCNSQLSVPPESGFLVWWRSKYKNTTAALLASPKYLESLIEDVLSSKKMETWGLEKLALLTYVAKHTPTNYAEVASLVYYFQAEMRGKKPIHWGDKNNYYIHHLEEILSLYPNAKFIHLIRDGRDVACSYRNLKNLNSSSAYLPHLPFKIEDIAKEWTKNIENIDRFLFQIPKEKSLIVRYEDLIISLEENCKKVCEFLDVEYDSTMLLYSELNKKNKIEPAETLDWKKNTLKKPDASRIQQYKGQLSEEEIAVFNRIAKVQLRSNQYV